MTVDKVDKTGQFVKVRTERTGFKPSERWRITRNVLVIGLAFMVHFTAFMGATNLQSSINADQSLGTFTLAAIYGSLIFSNIFLPTLVIRYDVSSVLFYRIYLCKLICIVFKSNFLSDIVFHHTFIFNIDNIVVV